MIDRLTSDPFVAPQSSLTVTVTGETREHAHIRCAGEIDQFTAPRLADALAAAVPGRRLVEVDLSDVTFMDSSGINTLVQHRRPGCDLIVVDVPPRIRRVLEMTGVDQLFCR
ncbi:STAS domain-containing protein [Actinoplanes sp. NPDC051346]|uniref:STAS domain-containing protein n=1 Tax=Actinoplanes sp. NPDC051346 TaxID=3155048 RepID=UPI0034482B89